MGESGTRVDRVRQGAPSGRDAPAFRAYPSGVGTLNGLRREWGLPDIPMPRFNNYLYRDRVFQALAGKGLTLVEAVNFASTYFSGPVC